MRLEDIESFAQPGVVNNIGIQAIHNRGGSCCEFDSRPRPSNGVARNVRRQRRLTKALANDMQFIALFSDGCNELPGPVTHSTAARIQVVDYEGDSHLCGPLPRTPVD